MRNPLLAGPGQVRRFLDLTGPTRPAESDPNHENYYRPDPTRNPTGRVGSGQEVDITGPTPPTRTNPIHEKKYEPDPTREKIITRPVRTALHFWYIFVQQSVASAVAACEHCERAAYRVVGSCCAPVLPYDYFRTYTKIRVHQLFLGIFTGQVKPRLAGRDGSGRIGSGRYRAVRF